MAVTDIFTLDEYIDHVKVSGSLTEENREYIDVRDLQVIIDLAKREYGKNDTISRGTAETQRTDRG
jgi:hypothetical protein